MRDLQQRLDEHERRGVQATLEMQQAARHAARENEKLRALLLRKGVSDAEVQEFLRHEDPNNVDDRRNRQQLTARPPAASGTPGVSSVAALLNGQQLGTPPRSRHLGPLPGSSHGRRDANSSLLEQPVMPREDETTPSWAEWPGPSEATSSHLSDPVGCHESGMETSCDVAAAILADMQGHGDTSRVRVVLGCTQPGECIVKNTRVFDLLDEAG